MNRLLISVALGAGFLLSVSAYADAPAGATAQCKDGTYYSGTEHKGACKGHQGVKEWLDKTAATPAATPAAAPAAKPAPKAAAKPAAAPAADTTTTAATTSKKPSTKKTTAATATPPAGSTARCKDGTYYSGTEHKGACKGHKGVKEWLDKTAAEPAVTPTVKPAPKPAAAPATTAPAAAAPAPAAPAKPAPATAAPAATGPSTTRAAPTPASQIAQKAGGGPGLVWVNSSTKVYHCDGDEWYGKTKEGSYMTEAAATAAGNRPANGKTCSK